MKIKIIKISIILLAIALNICGMESPSTIETVPVALQDLHHKEQLKFKKYDLDHPEKFLQMMRSQFNFGGNKIHI